jgi:hypothetical protein
MTLLSSMGLSIEGISFGEEEATWHSVCSERNCPQDRLRMSKDTCKENAGESAGLPSQWSEKKSDRKVPPWTSGYKTDWQHGQA